jgi:hydroxyacylglutathione hydrolase
MYIQQLYTNCLSEAAYFIESNGEAAIIDPLRDIDVYIKLAAEKNATIKYIFETHFHADFVSGHLDLANATGATIVFGPSTTTNFPIHLAKDGEIFTLGNTSIKVLHTPGHTLESTCYLLANEDGKDHAIFTGDTLFIGDVGRPDLSSGNLTSDELAAILYDTLQNKILPLHNDVIVYPAHGPGSSCGKNIGPETHSTIGLQKISNYALQPQTKEAFIAAVTEGLTEAPPYFAINAQINKEGYPALVQVLTQGMQALSVADFKEKMKDENVLILDTRNATSFTMGFVPSSIFIGLEGRFAEWAGSLLPFDKPILLVTDIGQEKETIIRLARVGFDKIIGHLAGGFAAWQQANQPIDIIIDVEADELAMDIPHDPNLTIVDVRKEIEYGDGHVKDAINLPLGDFNDPATMAMIEDNMNTYVHCAGGYRSVIALSIFKREGVHNVRNIIGGFNAIKEQESIKIIKEESVLN